MYAFWSKFFYFEMLKTCFLHVLKHFWSFKAKKILWFSGGPSVPRSLGPTVLRNGAIRACNFWSVQQISRFNMSFYSIDRTDIILSKKKWFFLTVFFKHFFFKFFKPMMYFLNGIYDFNNQYVIRKRIENRTFLAKKI